jgi:beta-galactosidase
MLDKLESDHRLYPERIIYTSESYSTSAYDFWKAVEKYPYVIGDFVWTAWEYLGESNVSTRNYIPEGQNNIMSGNFSNFKLPKGKNIFDILARGRSTWPKFMADCSDIDITGEAKASMGYRNILWDNSKIEVYVHEPMPEGMKESGSAWAWQLEYPYWNWPDSEGKIMQVRVFTKAPEVALMLNGKILADKKLTDEDKYIAVFKVPYQAGELKAIGLKDGREIASKTLKTPDEPVAIKLTADRTKINAGYTDLAFIKIEVVDKTGELASYAKNSIRLEVQGNGKLIGSGNANPSDMNGFNQSQFDVYYGKAQAIIRPVDKQGEIKVKAISANLKPAEIIINVQ